MSQITAPIRVSPPLKRRLDVLLAGIAGALAVLVAIVAHGAIVAPSERGEVTASPAISPVETATDAPRPTPAPQVAPPRNGDDHHGGKGRG